MDIRESAMDAPRQPQLCLATPPVIDLESFPDQLDAILNRVAIACVRIDLASHDNNRLIRTADILRETAHSHDVAIVVRDHIQMVAKCGLDGVHLSSANRSVRDARKALGSEAIVGCHCGNSRHSGISAGEAGADYVSFGPISETFPGDEGIADRDLFQWWSEIIEIPVMAEGGLGMARVAELSPFVDFLSFGEEIWNDENPGVMLERLIDTNLR